MNRANVREISQEIERVEGEYVGEEVDVKISREIPLICGFGRKDWRRKREPSTGGRFCEEA
jgi:hypothetical protein